MNRKDLDRGVNAIRAAVVGGKVACSIVSQVWLGGNDCHLEVNGSKRSCALVVQ